MAQLLEETKSSSPAPKRSMYGSFLQLPPKIPTNCPPTPNHHHHRHLPVQPSEPSWTDEFLRSPAPIHHAHRRAVSDSSTDSTSPDFGRLHHNVLHSSSTAPCTPSDNDSITDDEPNPNQTDPPAWSDHDQSEAQSSCIAEQQASPAADAESQPIVDPKRLKRILANRKSAQRSRVRKLQYITELERTVTKLQMEVSTLSPRVAFLDHQRSILTVGNSQLKHQITALAQDNIFKDAHQESLKKEIESLRRAHHQQIIKKMDAMTPDDYY